MADQVADLEQAGFFFATFINGNLSAAERRQQLSELRSGSKGLLYISPEQLLLNLINKPASGSLARGSGRCRK